jgi:hypothetical protein
MLKLASAIAVVSLMTTAAMGQTLPAGQYNAETQFTGLVDPAGLCASTVIVGSVTGGVATLNDPGATGSALGNAWSQTQVQTATSSPYTASTISCSFSALPTAASFTGSPPSAPNNGVGTCIDSLNSLTYTLTTSNNAGGSPPSSSTATFLPVNGKDDGLRLDQSNGALAVGGNTVCFISTQTVLLRKGT